MTQVSAQQPTAIPVGTVAAELRPVTRAAEFVGRVEAIERVRIRARITGFLQDTLFKEGELVKAGDVLYRIEPETFQAAAQQAQGALLQAQGNLANATLQLNRTQELAKSETASRALLDERTANQKDAQGALIIADANLKTANVNLSYTAITAPITGEIGRSKLTKGNVVGPDSGVLTEIVSRDPMYVTFPVSQREFLRFQEAAERRQAREMLAVRIRFSDGTLYDQIGQIDFIDVTVDQGDRYRAGAGGDIQPTGRADRWSARARVVGSRQAPGEGADPAVGADRRSARHLRVRSGGRQGGDQAGEDRGRAGRQRHR